MRVVKTFGGSLAHSRTEPALEFSPVGAAGSYRDIHGQSFEGRESCWTSHKQLEEVPDEELNAPQMGNKEEEDDWDTDSESEVSEVEDDEIPDESLFDRIAALQDIVPPSYRKTLGNITSTGYSWASSAVSFSGKTLWVVSTSALLLGVPWALAFSEEQQVQEMEREMRMQQSANELLTQGANAGQQQAKPAL
ncbi:hypothetical protein D0869_00634 [Hortaea werneckii]|uniref:Mitochondrial import receptor subunit tom22 n=1 Tax=Hortaea werneckii TaxID=91943 RepID=A0A3M6XG34_HORWE|nr:hypothetical protein D0869_00634 [Hortaea werneckii]